MKTEEHKNELVKLYKLAVDSNNLTLACEILKQLDKITTSDKSVFS